MAAEVAQVAQEALTDALRRLIKTDPDPRAQAVLLVEHGQMLASVGRLL
jgi:hypothetical protein